jgi:hypothetical protein
MCNVALLFTDATRVSFLTQASIAFTPVLETVTGRAWPISLAPSPPPPPLPPHMIPLLHAPSFACSVCCIIFHFWRYFISHTSCSSSSSSPSFVTYLKKCGFKMHVDDVAGDTFQALLSGGKVSSITWLGCLLAIVGVVVLAGTIT